jgi:hypothetical protein
LVTADKSANELQVVAGNLNLTVNKNFFCKKDSALENCFHSTSVQFSASILVMKDLSINDDSSLEHWSSQKLHSWILLPKS